MRAVIQRVTRASVSIDGTVKGGIERGLAVLLGIHGQDGEAELKYIAEKIINLRIFEDAEGKMNRSVQEIGGAVLLVSQFTLYGDARKGRRPGFTDAARPETAIPLYEQCIALLQQSVPVQTGQFGADMQVELVNDGPVTILLDSSRMF